MKQPSFCLVFFVFLSPVLLTWAQQQEPTKEELVILAKGEEIFEMKCAGCHEVFNDDRKVGPSLKGLFKREKLEDDRPMTEENVDHVIVHGGEEMPPFGDSLDEKARAAIIAYLKRM